MNLYPRVHKGWQYMKRPGSGQCLWKPVKEKKAEHQLKACIPVRGKEPEKGPTLFLLALFVYALWLVNSGLYLPSFKGFLRLSRLASKSCLGLGLFNCKPVCKRCINRNWQIRHSICTADMRFCSPLLRGPAAHYWQSFRLICQFISTNDKELLSLCDKFKRINTWETRGQS